MEYLQSNHDFESIIDAPLSSSEGTNHHDTQRESTRKQTPQAKFLHSLHMQKVNIL